MNRKGFTLIELLAVIVIIALVAVLVSPSIIGLFNTSKDKLYDIMIEDIKTAGENYYQECEYGDLKNVTKATGCINKQSDSNQITVTLGELVQTGFLKSDSENDQSNKIENPKTGNDISKCTVTITKVRSETGNNVTINTTFNNKEVCIDGEYNEFSRK